MNRHISNYKPQGSQNLQKLVQAGNQTNKYNPKSKINETTNYSKSLKLETNQVPKEQADLKNILYLHMEFYSVILKKSQISGTLIQNMVNLQPYAKLKKKQIQVVHKIYFHFNKII